MRNSFYFSHDYHARFDPKLCALIKKYGMEGYGVWWMLIEILHEQGGKIEKFPKLFEGLAHDLKQNEAHLKQIVSALISDYCLLKEDDDYIWSDRVVRNMEEFQEKRQKKSEAGRLGGISSGIKRSKTKQNEAPLEANELKKRKVNESKVDKEEEHIIKEYKKFTNFEFVLLTEVEYNKLLARFGDSGVAHWINTLNNYIGSGTPAIKKEYEKRNHYFTIIKWSQKPDAPQFEPIPDAKPDNVSEEQKQIAIERLEKFKQDLNGRKNGTI